MSSPAAPKILLAKPSVSPITGKFGRGNSDDDNASHRSRLPPVSSLNMLSDSWDFHIDRFLPVIPSLSFYSSFELNEVEILNSFDIVTMLDLSDFVLEILCLVKSSFEA